MSVLAAAAACILWATSPGLSQAAPRLTRSSAAPLATVTAGGTIRALVVGIDRYRVVDYWLQGAVADALDIAETLRRAGVGDVTTLLDEQASRARLLDAIDAIARRTRPDDLVLIAFAGHGAQEAVVPSPAEPDGKDEFFLLWGFAGSGEATRERIVDDEMFASIGRIAATGARTIFLADVCFGGGLSKAVDPRIGRPSVRALKRVARPELAGRGAYYIDPAEDKLPRLANIPGGDNATQSYPLLTFIAAVDDQHEAPEISIQGETSKRGAASYVLARALEGQADREGDGNGITTRRELLDFVRRHVRVLSSHRQTPVGEPRAAGTAGIALFRSGVAATAVPPPASEPATAPPKLVELAAALETTSRDAELLWDRRTGDVLSQSGDVLAYSVASPDLPAVIERVVAFRELVRLAGGRSLDMTIAPIDRIFALGERFEARIDGLHGMHLVLINLAGDGTVQYLLPDGNADNLMTTESLTLPLRSGPPFGTDSLVAILTRERRPALELDLKLLDKRRQPKAFIGALERHLDVTDRIAIGTYSTRPASIVP